MYLNILLDGYLWKDIHGKMYTRYLETIQGSFLARAHELFIIFDNNPNICRSDYLIHHSFPLKKRKKVIADTSNHFLCCF